MLPPTPWLATERLALRRLTPADLDWWLSFQADPDVMRYAGGVKDRARAIEALDARVLRYYDEHPGLGVWLTIERSSGTPIGTHSLNHVHGESSIQVGFLLHKPFWGKGYASEMGLALLRHGFVDLALPQIVGIANTDNVASHRALVKIGLERRGERDPAHPFYAGHGPFAWFERDAEAWIAERHSR